MLSGLTGVLWSARFGTVDAVIAPDLQLQSISAAVVGGVSIFGGSGSVYGAAIGAVIFAVLQNGVQLLGFDQFWIPALLGVAILGTVLLYSRLANRGNAPDRFETIAGSREGRVVRLRSLAPRWEAFLLLVLVVVLLLGAQASDHFLTASNISIALAGMMPVAIVALPMTLIIVMGEIDISVGSIIGLCASIMGLCLEHHLPVVLAMVSGLAIGMLAAVQWRHDRRLWATVIGRHDWHARALSRGCADYPQGEGALIAFRTGTSRSGSA
jgi:ribose/xylose/arabinose/galactoside ABC-type transport system permease subunit